MTIPTGVTNWFKSDSTKLQFRALQAIVKSELQQAIWRYVYQAYKPEYYERTYELLNAITETDIVFERKDGVTKLSFKVYIDPEKMWHKNLAKSKRPPLEKGSFIPNVGALIDEGYAWDGYSTTGDFDYFHNRPPSNFLERAIEEIQKDLNDAVYSLLVQKFGSKDTFA